MINLRLTTAVWLSLATPIAHSSEAPPSVQEHIFLGADHLTEITPVWLNFHPDQLSFVEANREAVRKWAAGLGNYPVRVHIYSYASLPTGLRDQKADTRHHFAVRKAFNRGLAARNILEQEGVASKNIILHAIGPAATAAGGSEDQVHITVREDDERQKQAQNQLLP